MHIINIEDAYMQDTPDTEAIASTARTILDAATTNETDVTATITKHDNTLTVHHTHDNTRAVNTLTALATLTQELAHDTHTTPQETADMTLQVIEEAHGHDTDTR